MVECMIPAAKPRIHVVTGSIPVGFIFCSYVKLRFYKGAWTILGLASLRATAMTQFSNNISTREIHLPG